jgi:hypothetical protein
MMDEMSSSDWALRKRARMEGEYLDRAPPPEATLTRRPVGVRSGRKAWQAERVE